jgi:hypothetical protein
LSARPDAGGRQRRRLPQRARGRRRQRRRRGARRAKPAPAAGAADHDRAAARRGGLTAARPASAAFTDPGPEEGAAEAWAKYVERDARSANRALNANLGDFNVKLLNQKWATEAGLRGKVLNGELSVENLEDTLLDHWTEAEGKRLSRKQNREEDYGYNRRSIPCFSCGHLKRRPADVCDVCGDDPVPTATYGLHNRGVGTSSASAKERMDFNRAYGYGSL